MRLILPIWILLLHMTCAWGLLIPQETRMGAEGWAAYSPSSTSTSTQASRSATRTVNYTYDDLHRLTGEVLGGSEETGTVAYTLDDVGNRLGRTSSVAGITPQSLSYSANDWLNSHQYDANGNTLRSDLTSGSVARDAYDFKNRLSQRRIYDASGTVLQKIVDLRYDGDGALKWKRVTDTTTGEETIRYFVVDHHNLTGYSQIVEELDATGAVVATYHYGHDLISQSRLVVDETTGASEWVDRIFLYDGGGHVRALTDLEGNITDTFSYDAYGNLLGYGLSAIGSLPTAYLYRGERYDPDLGQYYLRARFYDANLGRFHTLDEYEGRTGEPLSLHKYLYAHANPVTGWDPSGRMTLGEMSMVTSSLRNLVSLAVKTLNVYFRIRSILSIVDGLRAVYAMASNPVEILGHLRMLSGSPDKKFLRLFDQDFYNAAFLTLGGNLSVLIDRVIRYKGGDVLDAIKNGSGWIIYMPTPSFGPNPTFILNLKKKIAGLPVKLQFGGGGNKRDGKHKGRFIGIGVQARGGKNDCSLFRMDWHTPKPDNKHIIGDRYWIDGEFHFHV